MFFLLPFMFFLLQNLPRIQEVEGGGGEVKGSGRALGGGRERGTVVQLMCTHVCKCKNDTCGNCSRNGGVKESSGGGEFKCDIFDTL
jgi:hypothetical protein